MNSVHKDVYACVCECEQLNEISSLALKVHSSTQRGRKYHKKGWVIGLYVHWRHTDSLRVKVSYVVWAAVTEIPETCGTHSIFTAFKNLIYFLLLGFFGGVFIHDCCQKLFLFFFPYISAQESAVASISTQWVTGVAEPFKEEKSPCHSTRFLSCLPQNVSWHKALVLVSAHSHSTANKCDLLFFFSSHC